MEPAAQFRDLQTYRRQHPGQRDRVRPAQGIGILRLPVCGVRTGIFTVLLAIMFHIPGYEPSRTDRLMLAFAVPPLVLVTGLGFVTRALANWAAPAFVSAVIVAVAILLRHGAWKWLSLSLGLGVAAEALLLVTDAMATRLHVPGLTRGDIYQR